MLVKTPTSASPFIDRSSHFAFFAFVGVFHQQRVNQRQKILIARFKKFGANVSRFLTYHKG